MSVNAFQFKFPSNKLFASFESEQSIEFGDLHNHIFAFLGRADQARFSVVNLLWREYMIHNRNWIWAQKYQILIPGFDANRLGLSVDYLEAYKTTYRDVVSREFYLEMFGADIGFVPPVPQHLLTKAVHLMYVPEFLMISVPSDSLVGLDCEGKLIEEPLLHAQIPSSYVRLNKVMGQVELKVPVTIRNIQMLADKHLKCGFQPRSDCNHSEVVITPFEDERQTSHWSCQNKFLVGAGLTMIEQGALIEAAGFAVSSLLDRFLYNIFTHIRSGRCPDSEKAAKTSSRIYVENGEDDAGRVSIFWLAPSISARVDILVGVIDEFAGVATELKSS